MRHFVINVLACAAVLIGPMIPRADASPWLRTLLSELNPGSGLRAPTRAPVPDRGVQRLREVGHGKRMTGVGGSHYVGFTFDDGPSWVYTPKTLDALAAYDIPATFFVVGWRLAGDTESARRNRATLDRIIRDGHMVGNHTFRHKDIKRQSPRGFKQAIAHAGDLIAKQLGFRPVLFRPPYGAMQRRATTYLTQERYTEVRWNIDSLDFKTFRSRTLRNRTMSLIKSWKGGVVLFHDTKKITARTIARVFDDLEAENCRRLSKGETPLIPVSLHYFMREPDGHPRPVPAHAAERTARYRKNLPARCQRRIDKGKTTH